MPNDRLQAETDPPPSHEARKVTSLRAFMFMRGVPGSSG